MFLFGSGSGQENWSQVQLGRRPALTRCRVALNGDNPNWKKYGRATGNTYTCAALRQRGVCMAADDATNSTFAV